jgi:hypothetical protein
MNPNLPEFNHQAARRALDQRLDIPLDAGTQAELEKHLASCEACRKYAAAQVKLEQGLHHALHERWPESAVEPVPVTLHTSLEQEKFNLRSQTMTKKSQGGIKVVFSGARFLGYAAAILVFILAFAWVLRFLGPRQATTGPQPTSASTQTPEISSQQEPTQKSPEVVTKATEAEPLSSTSPLFPNLQFEIGVALPYAPREAMVYTQAHPQAATLENIQAMASRLGAEGTIYQQPGEGPDPIYIVTDGKGWITFPYGSAEFFLYYPDYPHVLAYTPSNLPFEQQAAVAETFLIEHGLLEPPYQVEAVTGYPGGVHFVRTLDDRPVIYGVGYFPSLVDLDVQIGMDGQVSQVTYGARYFQPAQKLPVLTASKAWEEFLSGALEGVRYAVNTPQDLVTNGYRAWVRPYPDGELVHLYGYAQLAQPAAANGEAIAFFNNWQVKGTNAGAFIAQLINDQMMKYSFLHAWGTLQTDAAGKQSLAVQGWEVSPFEDQFFSGVLNRRADGASISNESGNYALADVPDELADQSQIDVRGVISQPGVIEWSLLTTGVPANGGYGMMDACAGGGGGGGDSSIGGGSFKRFSLQELAGNAQPTSTVVALSGPFKVGDKVDGVQGILTIYRHILMDGKETIDANLSGEPGDFFPDYWTLRLTGDQVAALEPYAGLPMKAWGTVNGVTSEGFPILLIERFEEAYPGLKIEAWLGKTESATVEGQEVLIFTTTDGKQFVLASSIDPNNPLPEYGLPGDQLVVEGLARPDRSFGGYPLIDPFGISVANGMTSLDSYQIDANQVRVWDERQSSSSADLAQALSGKAVVDKVELVYAAASLQQCFGNTETDPEKAPWLYVQPAWRFTGHLEDGKTFEIQVQAAEGLYKK